MWWNNGGWGWGLAMGVGMLFMLAFWGGIIALIVWGIMKLSRGASSGLGGGKSALDIARERYARGEITKEQFEQLKNDLS